jgi:prepilin-type N-terminal cleavage/methylation domain-containing protein
MRRAPRQEFSRGFTLVEMVIVIVLVGVMFGIGALILGHAFESYDLTRETNTVDWQGRVAMERMAREFRDIRSNAATDLDIASATQLRFVDADGNGVCFYRDAVSNQIMRSASGLALACNAVAANPQPLADSITALNFFYYDQAGNVTAVPASTFYVTVTATVVQGQLNEAYRMTVQPRRF